jgi:antirestriction protein ArdC
LAGSAVTGRGSRERLAAPVAEIRDVTFILPHAEALIAATDADFRIRGDRGLLQPHP